MWTRRLSTLGKCGFCSAEAAGFDVLVTTDKNRRYQQNLAGRNIAIIALGRQQWPEIRPHVEVIAAAVNANVASVHMSVNAARMSACATMISIIY